MQYIGFTLSNNEYTVPISKVQEIIKLPQITKLPQSPSYVEGITNMRGKIITIINLKKMLGIREEQACEKVIVLASGRVSFGVLVDAITGVVTIEQSEIEPSENFMKDNLDRVDGVAKVNDRLLVMLDPKKVVPVEDMQMFEDEVIEVTDTGGDTVEIVKKVEGIGGDMLVREIIDAKEYLKNKGVDKKDPRFVVLDDLVNFMDALVNRDFQKTNELTEKIIVKGQEGLFKELGKLTRKIHDTMKGFNETHIPKLKTITAKEMPHAADNLHLVIKGTEDAANRTLGIVEKYFEMMIDFNTKMQQFKNLNDAVTYMSDFKKGFEKDLTELLTIQEFQDLTGRTLKDVITLVGDVEKDMVKLLASFGMKVEQDDREAIVTEKISQAGVDSLLKDLGF